MGVRGIVYWVVSSYTPKAIENLAKRSRDSEAITRPKRMDMQHSGSIMTIEIFYNFIP
jgi:hypothetical protein